MRLGLIGYLNNSGLGMMNQDLLRIFDFDAHLVIPGGDKGTDMSMARAKTNLLAKMWLPEDKELDWLFDNCDVVVTIETDFNSGLFKKARARGVRTVFMPMWEWFDHERYVGASVYLCTSKMGYESIKFHNKVYFPWPVDTAKFKFKERGAGPNKVFVHNAGFGGMNWRKGTLEAVAAFNMVKQPDLKLLLRTQKPFNQYPMQFQNTVNEDSRIILDARDFPDNASIYEEGDVYLYPARYDGQALVPEEAMACGFPVFVTDAPPMNEFTIDPRFMIKVASAEAMQVMDHTVPLNICDVADLANHIMWATCEDLRETSHRNRNIIQEHYSWDRWFTTYRDVLLGVYDER